MAEIELINLLKNHHLSYVPIESQQSLIKIYSLFCHRVQFEPSTATEYFYVGRYYHHFVNDYDLMKKYYLEAVDLCHPSAMNNLGIYYDDTEDYDLSKKYFLMAIELKNPMAMYSLALYYEQVESNYELMEKYYLEASDLQHAISIKVLAEYYFETENAVKLFHFCIKHSIYNDDYMKLALGISIDTETEFIS